MSLNHNFCRKYGNLDSAENKMSKLRLNELTLHYLSLTILIDNISVYLALPYVFTYLFLKDFLKFLCRRRTL